MVVHVAVGNDILNMAVIAAERAAPRVAGRNAGQERSEVLGGGAFAYKDVAAPRRFSRISSSVVHSWVFVMPVTR